jgi:tellurite resistance protein TehA-like permease
MVATLWIPLLVVAGRWLDTHRAGAWWAAVFPLGMYSAATYAMAGETGWRTLTVVSLVFFWIAFAAWLIVAGGVLAELSARRSRT